MMRRSCELACLLWLIALVALPLGAQEGEGTEAEPAVEPAPAEGEQAAGGEARLLRLSFAPGEELIYRMELNGLGSVHVAGTAQAVALNGAMDMILRVVEVSEEGNFTIRTRLDATDLQVTVDGQPIPAFGSLPQMRAVVTPRGETLEFEMLGAPATGGMEAQLAQMLAGENFKSLLQVQRMAAFPEAPVAPGAKWSGKLPVQAQVEGQTPTEITTTYVCDQEFEGVMCARLKSDAVIGMDALGPIAGMLEMSGTTTQQTTTWFDFAAGRVRATQEQSQISLQLTVPAAMTQGQGQIGMFMEMFIEIHAWLLPPPED
ncbi:MAG: hypothetical protein AB7Y46_16580 [Armatimonadota bacterium]